MVLSRTGLGSRAGLLSPRRYYRITKEKLLTQPKGKQFDFSENQIFGKFELFCKRIQKLVDMFPPGLSSATGRRVSLIRTNGERTLVKLQ